MQMIAFGKCIMKRVSRQSDVDGFVRQVLILGASRSPFWGPTGPLSTSPKSSFWAGQLKKGAGGGAAATATCSVPEAPFAPGEELSVQVLH